MTPSFFYTKKVLKKEGNEAWYQGAMFNNYKDQLPNNLKGCGLK